MQKTRTLNKHLILFLSLIGLGPVIFGLWDEWNNGGNSFWLGTSAFETVWHIFYSIAVTIVISITVMSAVNWLHKRMPWEGNVLRRIIAEFFLSEAVALGSMFIISNILFFLDIQDGTSYWKCISSSMATAAVMNALIVTFYEGWYIFDEWKASLVEAEKYKKESVQAQYNSLKSQVNPHFLFNSLNTLRNLIDHDITSSKKFVEDLADVYRYVLNSRERECVELREELKFVDAYLFLLNKRHGDSLIVNLDIPEKYLSHMICPLTLQLLIENAVKHNIVSKAKPLLIDVYVAKDHLVICNILQKKKADYSTGFGLKNIRSRYEFLSDSELIIRENKSEFIVKVPLLEPDFQSIHLKEAVKPKSFSLN